MASSATVADGSWTAVLLLLLVVVVVVVADLSEIKPGAVHVS